MKRLTEAEKNLVCDMCTIAGAQSQNEDGEGEGDFTGWTEDDFNLDDAIFEKLFDAAARKSIVKRLEDDK